MDKKIKILFFASNPEDVQPLKLDEEIRSITTNIRAAEYRDALDLISIWAVRPDDLLQELNTHKPTVVHFSGHGSNSGELILMNDSRQAKMVSPPALKALFSTLKDNIRLVVLNACYSKMQAKAIAQVIDCVVGMNTSIGDNAAIAFAASFYRAIGFGRSVKESFEQGKVSLMLENIPEKNTPKLLVRKGVDPTSVYLVSQDIIAINLEVAGAILNLHSRFKTAVPDRKERIATYYKKIADTLQEVASSLRNNIVPHGNCEKMLTYAQELPDAIGDFVGMEKANELSSKLQQAYNVESLLKELNAMNNREAKLADLEKAAGYFEASADTLLTSL